MVEIDTFKDSNRKNIDKSNSILLIGKAESEYKNLEIIYCNSIERVEYIYGKDSDIYNAFNELIAMGINEAYICNCYLFTDYIKVLNNINEEYGFICPLFNFSEFYKTDSSTKVYLAELYSNIIANGLTEIIFTDKHASYYETIEQYIKEMNQINMNFKSLSFNNLTYGENLCFVLNNLQKYKFANVVLAAILVQADLKYYPNANIGDVVFDLNNNDFYGQEIIYFAYNYLTGTTIENLLNFRLVNDPEKFIPIHLIVLKIKRALMFDEFIGKLFTKYTQIQIENKLVEIMDSFVDNLIRSYNIKNIQYQKVHNGSNITIRVIILLSILPFNSIEDIELSLEV